MDLTEYYKRITMYPSVVVLGTVTLYAIIDNFNYKSEWLTAESVIFMSLVGACISCSILSLLSLTIFLNKFEKIRTNTVFKFLSWFLLPFGWMLGILIHEIYFKIKFETKSGSDFIYMLILNIPFAFALIRNYKYYLKEEKVFSS